MTLTSFEALSARMPARSHSDAPHGMRPRHSLFHSTGARKVAAAAYWAVLVAVIAALSTSGAGLRELDKVTRTSFRDRMPGRTLLQTAAGSGGGSADSGGAEPAAHPTGSTRRRRAGSAAHRRHEGEEGPWWPYPGNYTQMEAVIVVLLVVVSIGWEIVMDVFLEEVEHQPSLGIRRAFTLHADEASYDSDEEGKEEPEQSLYPKSSTEHYLDLFKRLVAEIMILGCLAFTVWLIDNFGIFDIVTKAVSNVPVEGVHETLENTHMMLFLTMVSTFVCLAHTTRAAMHYSCRIRVVHLKREASSPPESP